MPIFTNSKGERIETKRDAGGKITRTVLNNSPMESTYEINSSTLNPQDDIKMTQPKSMVGTDGMLAEFKQKSEDAFSESIKANRDKREQGFEEARKVYQNILGNQVGEIALQEDLYSKKGGVDEIQTELDAINQEIRAEQRSLESQLRTLEEKGGGLQAGAEAEMRNVRRQSLRTQADLFVIQQGIQGKYDSAKAIADRAVSRYLEAQKLEYDAAKQNYEDNKDLFTTAEQREFDVAFDAKKREYEREENELNTISDLSLNALRNGASPQVASQMRKASSVAEAMEIGGAFVDRYERLKAEASLASAEIQRKLSLYELAKAGDENALIELGLNPNTPDITKKVQAQEQITKLDDELARVSSMINNTTGIEASSGLVQNAFLSSYGASIPTGAVTGFGAGSVVPGLGTITGTALGLASGIVTGTLELQRVSDAKSDFLAKANHIMANLTAEKVRELKESGVAFTPMTDKDVDLISRSVGEIEGYAIRENGKIVGFTSESGVKDALVQISEILQEARSREFKKMLSDSEIAEIDSL